MTDFTVAARQLAEQAIDLQKRIDAKRAEYDEVDKHEPMRTAPQRDSVLTTSRACGQGIDNDTRPLPLQGQQHGCRGKTHAAPTRPASC